MTCLTGQMFQILIWSTTLGSLQIVIAPLQCNFSIMNVLQVTFPTFLDLAWVPRLPFLLCKNSITWSSLNLNCNQSKPASHLFCSGSKSAIKGKSTNQLLLKKLLLFSSLKFIVHIFPFAKHNRSHVPCFVHFVDGYKYELRFTKCYLLPLHPFTNYIWLQVPQTNSCIPDAPLA